MAMHGMKSANPLKSYWIIVKIAAKSMKAVKVVLNMWK